MNDTIQQIVDRNESQFNYLKLLEELAELTEVIIKRVNKQIQYKPSMEKIIEETGDVLIRLRIFCRAEGIADAVNQRVITKLTKLNGYFETNEFKNI